jgi:hypothetical protein
MFSSVENWHVEFFILMILRRGLIAGYKYLNKKAQVCATGFVEPRAMPGWSCSSI